MNPAPATGAPGRSDTAFVGEAEAYALLARAGLRPPRHARVGGPLPFAAGEPVVVKGLGEELWHKSELGAVAFLPFGLTDVLDAVAGMRRRVEAAGHRWLDGLVCERVAIARAEGLPAEAFVSLTRGEAGWVVLFGCGGMAADALVAVAPPLRWPLEFTTEVEALAELQGHLLGQVWLGRLRGTKSLTTEAQLSELKLKIEARAPMAMPDIHLEQHQTQDQTQDQDRGAVPQPRIVPVPTPAPAPNPFLSALATDALKFAIV